MSDEDKIAQLERRIQELEKEKPKGSFDFKIRDNHSIQMVLMKKRHPYIGRNPKPGMKETVVYVPVDAESPNMSLQRWLSKGFRPVNLDTPQSKEIAEIYDALGVSNQAGPEGQIQVSIEHGEVKPEKTRGKSMKQAHAPKG